VIPTIADTTEVLAIPATSTEANSTTTGTPTGNLIVTVELVLDCDHLTTTVIDE
jgi:hypothetical protein